MRSLTASGKKLLQSVAQMAKMLQYHLPDGVGMTGMDAVTHNAGGIAYTEFNVWVFDEGMDSVPNHISLCKVLNIYYIYYPGISPQTCPQDSLLFFFLL